MTIVPSPSITSTSHNRPVVLPTIASFPECSPEMIIASSSTPPGCIGLRKRDGIDVTLAPGTIALTSISLAGSVPLTWAGFPVVVTTSPSRIFTPL